MLSRIHKRNLFFIFSLLAVAAFSPLYAGEGYKIDAMHSSVIFSVKHKQAAMFLGRFNDFEGTIVLDDNNPGQSNFEVVVKAGSVDTNSERRDKHLRSPDFFNAVQFPSVSFKSTKVEKTDGGFAVTGDLTLLGVTKPITVSVINVGEAEQANGSFLRGFYCSTTIKRSEFGMNFGIDNGGLGDNVELIFSLETRRG